MSWDDARGTDDRAGRPQGFLRAPAKLRDEVIEMGLLAADLDEWSKVNPNLYRP